MGLGIANTPVTNTTTGAAASDRAGMASGIDVRARMASLAVNIAVLGLIPVSGVLAHIEAAASNLDVARLRPLAETIAAGHAVSIPEVSAAVVHAALVQGFGWVMLYGGIGVWIMAGISLLLFHAPVQQGTGKEVADRGAD
jgi:hypothetical protein